METMTDKAKYTQETRKKTIPVIKNEMTGKNRFKTTKWHKGAEELEDLAKEADPGDLLEMDRGTIKHWALFAGPNLEADGRQEMYIVHFGFDPSEKTRELWSKPAINFNSLTAVAGESKVRINNKLDKGFGINPGKDVGVINKRIESFTNQGKPYNIFDHNCEIFATYCRYGLDVSEQSSSYGCMLSGLLTCSMFQRPSADLVGKAFVAPAVGLTIAASVVGLRRLAPKIGLGGEGSAIGLATVAFFLGLIIAGFIVSAALRISMDGMDYVSILFGARYATLAVGVKPTSVIIGILYFVYVGKQPGGAYVVLLTYLGSLFGPSYEIYGVPLPAMIYVIGLSYVASVNGPTFTLYVVKLPAAVYVVGLTTVAALINPTYVWLAMAMPLMIYYYGLKRVLCGVVIIIVFVFAIAAIVIYSL